MLVKLGDGTEWAALHLDSTAVLAVMDSLFASPEEEEEDEEEEEEEEEEVDLGEQLTLAQRALMQRVAVDMANAISETLRRETCLQCDGFEFLALKAEAPYEPPDDALAFELSIEEVPRPWVVRVYVGGRGMVAAARRAAEQKAGDVTLARALPPVPFDVVAELGRLTLKLSQVLSLRVGDVLRLPSAASDPIAISVGGVAKFDADPVISRGQVAVSIRSRHTQ